MTCSRKPSSLVLLSTAAALIMMLQSAALARDVSVGGISRSPQVSSPTLRSIDPSSIRGLKPHDPTQGGGNVNQNQGSGGDEWHWPDGSLKGGGQQSQGGGQQSQGSGGDEWHWPDGSLKGGGQQNMGGGHLTGLAKIKCMADCEKKHIKCRC